MLAVWVWSFYSFILPHVGSGFHSFVSSWFPASALNESLVWVICALGLNIVVGYAGLLDLGFVAFWAIGGYVAGWFMSDFFQQTSIHIGSVVTKEHRGIHLSFWAVLLLGGIICAFFGILIGALVMAWINSAGLQATGDAVNKTFHTNINFPSYNFLLFGLVLILMMLFRREGLLPESRLKRVMHENDDETANLGGH